MGCGASQPSDDGLSGGGAGSGILPTQGKLPSALAQTVTITSKPTKAVKPHKRQSTLTVSELASCKESVSAEEKERKRKKEGSIVPVSSLPSSPPPTTSNLLRTPLETIPPSPRNATSASTPSHARSLQPASTAAQSSPRASDSQSSASIESIPEVQPVSSLSLDRPRGGSHVLPPLKMKGRSAAALPVAAVADEITMTEPIRKKKSKRNNDEPATPKSPSTVASPGEERTPKARTQRSASSANLSLMALPASSKSLTRQSVVLAPLPPRGKTAPPQSPPPQQTQRGSMMPPPSAQPSKSPSISASSNSATSPPSVAATVATSPYFLSPDHQKQLDTCPSLWSSPTLLNAYPEAVFNHYAVISHIPPMHTDLMFISKKGVTRLGKDSVDEWMRVWRNRLTNDATGAAAGSEGANTSKAKEKKRAKGKMDTDGLLVLSRLLQMGKTSKKDVFKDDIDQWVVRRIRQELQADSEGRISKATFINCWKQCHKGIFNTGSDEQSKPSDENPMTCSIM